MVEITFLEAVEADEPHEVATVDQAKRWANIDHSDDDTLIRQMITGAREDIEKETNLKLIENTVTLHVALSGNVSLLSLPYGKPTDLVITDSEGQAVTDDHYKLKGDGLMFNTCGNYELTYKVGTHCPQALKEAVLMLVTYRYNNRGDQEKQHGLPNDIAHRVANYRKIWL